MTLTLEVFCRGSIFVFEEHFNYIDEGQVLWQYENKLCANTLNMRKDAFWAVFMFKWPCLDLGDILERHIRIFNSFEVLTENSVTMPNSYRSNGIFNLHRRTIIDSFSCILLLRQLHLDLNMCCFYQFCAKINFFNQKKFGTVPLLYVDVETFGRKWRQDVKNDIKTSKSS